MAKIDSGEAGPYLKSTCVVVKRKQNEMKKVKGEKGVCEWRGVGGYWGCRETHTPINKEETLEAK